MTLTAGSLFSGIGGLDLGLERAGMRVIWQSEINPYASRVLAKHWPDVPNLGDVTTIDWSSVERPDLICGGFPCQPASGAGRQLGVDDERWMWPEFARCLRVVRPEWVLVENVPGLLTVNDGRAFSDVMGTLADLGYDTEWECIPAAAVGAPHLRYRVFIVAHTNQQQLRQQPVAVLRGRGATFPAIHGTTRALADANGDRRPQRREPDSEPPTGLEPSRRTHPRRRSQDVADADGQRGQRRSAGPGQAPSDGSSAEAHRRGWWAAEPDVGRVADGVPARVDRLRALGNAVVPQVAEWIGHRITEHVRNAA